MLHNHDRREGHDISKHILHALIRHNFVLKVRLNAVVKYAGLHFLRAKAQEHAKCYQLEDVYFDLSKCQFCFFLFLSLTHFVEEQVIRDQPSHA